MSSIGAQEPTQEGFIHEGRKYPSYSSMISNLFKLITDGDNPFGSLTHAMVGIVGEAIEFKNSTSRKNLIEESGDLEFYIEALRQHYRWKEQHVAIDNGDTRAHATVSSVFDNIISLSGDILDIVKKSWVYRKDLNEKELARLHTLLELNMLYVYEFFGLNRADVQWANMLKLIGPGGRFEAGFYSDAAAIARADKVGEGRKFMGQTVGLEEGKLVGETKL